LVNENKQPGHYRAYWDGKDNHNNEVSSGIYICRLEAGKYKASMKMMLLK
jgi:hypothetical protein